MATLLFFTIIAACGVAGICIGAGFCLGSLKENRMETKTMAIIMSGFAGAFTGFPVSVITLLIGGAIGAL